MRLVLLSANLHNLSEIAKYLLVILVFYGDFHNNTEQIPSQIRTT